jgi:hypothetical protein
LAEHLKSAAACNFEDPTVLGTRSPNAIQAQRHVDVERDVTAAGATYLNVDPWFCIDGTCPVLLKNVLVYRDDNHITSRVSRLMEPLLERALLLNRS